MAGLLNRESDDKVRTAIRQWRDSLLNLTGRNRLLNYRPSRSTSLEFTRHTSDEIMEIIGSRAVTFVAGTLPPEKPKSSEAAGESEITEQLESAVIDQIEEFDFSKHPNHLFVEKTQRAVDQALRNLSRRAHSALVDRGLTVLYVGFGELTWTEESGDLRRSPLILLPATLTSAGLGKRTYVEFSDEDLAVNPALMLKLQKDFGIELPSTEDTIEKLESEGVEAAISLFRSVNFPSGWEVRESSILDVFLFSKEAMYRDLLNNESQIADSPIIQTLSGAVSAESSNFHFEEIDEDSLDAIAPPELTPLVLDADASQRAAIHAAAQGRSFTLDGPPGTGKSQTIANMIGALIAAGKTVLFVSEKAVALDVVRNRLADRGLGHLIFELHQSDAKRKEVAQRLGSALNNRPVPPDGIGSHKIEDLSDARKALTEYVEATNEVREPTGMTFHMMLGRLESLGEVPPGPSLESDPLSISLHDLAIIERRVLELEPLWTLNLEGRNANWYGLEFEGDRRYLLRRLALKLEEIQPVLSATRTVREAFSLTSLTDLAQTGRLLEKWHGSPEHHDEPWLDRPGFAELGSAVDRFEAATAKLAEKSSALQSLAGERYDEIEAGPSPTPTLDDDLRASLRLAEDSPASSLSSKLIRVRESGETLAAIEKRAQELARTIGTETPRSIRESRALLDTAAVLIAEHPPHVDWIYDNLSHSRASLAAEAAQRAEAELAEARQEASSVFTAATLEIDFTALEELARAERGFFSRFSSEHKSLRAALARISPAKWKTAHSNLHLARRWVAANLENHRLGELAQSALHPFYDRALGANWDEIGTRLANGAGPWPMPFTDRPSTQRVLEDRSARSLVADLGSELFSLLTRWSSESEALASSPDGDDRFGATSERLDDRMKRIEHLIEVVTANTPVVSMETSIRDHLAIAQAKVALDQARTHAELEATHLQRLTGSSGFEIELETSSKAHQKFSWALGVHQEASSEGAAAPLTEYQLEVLRAAPPAPTACRLHGEFSELVEEFLTWFSPERSSELRADLSDNQTAIELIRILEESEEDAPDWFRLQELLGSLNEAGLKPALESATSLRFSTQTASAFLRATVYRTWLDSVAAGDDRLHQGVVASRDQLVSQFRELDREIADQAISEIIRAGIDRRPRSRLGPSATIRREAEKKRKHIPVRSLIEQTKDVILGMHPCFMMSPLAVSQYLPPEELFDVVIFDEASQVLPSDAVNCIYRGRALIAAGDQKQLPPTSFFQSGVDDLEDDDEDDVAQDYESILDSMKSSAAFNAQTLRWHYRSRHEHLIAYSNTKFYENRLITFPGAISESGDLGVRYFKVPGIYRRSAGRDNPIEAIEVAKRVIHHFETRPNKTLGVVAFSTTQRDAIESAVELARQDRPDLDKYFTEDRSHGFFVKSLESVQGDERDVIIFSVGYGPDEQGRVYNQFGPLNKKGGERRLNVAISRAKELVEIVTSMDPSEIRDGASQGSRHLRGYLDFAQRGPDALQLELGSEGLDVESPFEDSVVTYIRSLGFEVQPQVGVAGYRIDIGVKHPRHEGAFMLGVECDGYMYHSSKVARDRDRLRHQVLEGLGWNLHHIWGTAWYRHPGREKETLRRLLEELATEPVVGRLTALRREAPRPISVESEVEEAGEVPSWVEDYRVAKVDRIGSRHDLSDRSNEWYLREFVEKVVDQESPIHQGVLAQRLRENSDYSRIGSKIQATLQAATRNANVTRRGDFIWSQEDRELRVRGGSDEFTRKAHEVPPEEMREAIRLTVADSLVVAEDQLVAAIARVFGWRRTGADIKDAIRKEISAMVRSNVLELRAGEIRLAK